jgi:hypothetical protein
MKRLRKYFFAIGLALAFAFGQHAAALHALGHAKDALTQNDSTPAPSKCADHSLFSTIGAALGSKAPVAPFVASVSQPVPAAIIASASLAPRFSFHSRAPPATPV